MVHGNSTLICLLTLHSWLSGWIVYSCSQHGTEKLLTFFWPFSLLEGYQQERQREGHESGWHSFNGETIHVIDSKGKAAVQQVQIHNPLSVPRLGVGGEQVLRITIQYSSSIFHSACHILITLVRDLGFKKKKSNIINLFSNLPPCRPMQSLGSFPLATMRHRAGAR